MRHPLVAALTLALIAVLGSFVSATPAAAAEPSATTKVVIIVGATHGTTSRYRDYADAAYAEAIKYTSNVVKVYSPNATWSKVKSAAVGANVVIYFGHGNGWPSPYTYDPEYKTKNGFGLNATAGDGDYNNKYYGEPYVSTLDLAPGAVVLLHHLCYAAGNSEPGQTAPTKSVAKQRVDNYAAGFLKAASVVIADGHRGPVDYLRALFTTDQTMADLWRTQPNANGNTFGFASSRTPGQTALMDPNTSTSGFYRSFVGNTAATTANVREGTEPDPNPTPPGVYQVQTVFDDLWDSRFAGSIQWIYDEKITVGCSATRFCPISPVTPRPDGGIPAARDGPAGGLEGLLQRRRREDVRGRHQRDRRGRHHRRLRARPVLPRRVRHPGPDGGLPRPRPGRPLDDDRLLQR